ncbi:hypothetical protein Syun_007609 [Stephania yunnanensis]|uniref:Uncharacterized protein n=1 Tax=Stephania yunnanensis TaxID=152371 RepID=A0AAP0L099_9MAGN
MISKPKLLGEGMRSAGVTGILVVKKHRSERKRQTKNDEMELKMAAVKEVVMALPAPHCPKRKRTTATKATMKKPDLSWSLSDFEIMGSIPHDLDELTWKSNFITDFFDDLPLVFFAS